MTTTLGDIESSGYSGVRSLLSRVAFSLQPDGPFIVDSVGQSSWSEQAVSGWASGRVGIFDSGLGGLSVARELIRALPDERICYAADSANFPYGPLSLEEVRRNSLAVMDELVAGGIKILVIACNTASAACLHDARERYDIPVVGVIVPAVRRALNVTRSGKIGVAATLATVRSNIYEDLLGCVAGATVSSVPCPLFADYAERGITTGLEISTIAAAYLSPLRSADVDTVVLGCTHYELLEEVIQAVLGPSVRLVSCSEETATTVAGILADLGQLNISGVVDGAWHEIRSSRPDEAFEAQLRTVLQSSWWTSGGLGIDHVIADANERMN